MEEHRTATASDSASILLLNAAHVQQTSPLDAGQLGVLAGMSAYFKVVTIDGAVAAFLIALRDGAPYLNDNFAWFATRYARYLYVDRIVVDARFAGRGLGSVLYKHLFDYARSNAIESITCEYNIVPPNPASRAFHDRFGFRQVGTQWVAGGSKQVSMQVATP